MNRLARSLTLYRMVFGQPRQEDMVRFLMQRVDVAKTPRDSGGHTSEL